MREFKLHLESDGKLELIGNIAIIPDDTTDEQFQELEDTDDFEWIFFEREIRDINIRLDFETDIRSIIRQRL